MTKPDQCVNTAGLLTTLRKDRIMATDDLISTPQGDCLEHTLKGNKNGYVQVRRHGVQTYLHRFEYCAKHGIDIRSIAGLVIRHTCDNPKCINPDHLLVGTTADNNRDMSIRRRHASVKLTDEQVVEILKTCVPNPRGGKRAPNPFSYCALAKKFGVKHAAVRQVYLRLSFKHIS